MMGVNRTHKEMIAREGWPFIGFCIVISALLYCISGYWSAGIGLVLTAFCVFFFRNPERMILNQKGLVVAPADGRIMDVQIVEEDKYLNSQAIRVRIFLSVFNVHINRNPIDGQVEWVNKVSGLNLAAYLDEASYKNVRNYVGIVTDWGKVLVVQITGLIARRVVCWVYPGDTLLTGQRLGIIRFGSCTEIYLPEGLEILVKPGQKVKGGETIIARFL
jgi:phosphatidylserine decarboxylase